MFKFLKNTVGRPSNEVLKKRKLFYFICALLIIFGISLGLLVLTGNKSVINLESLEMDKLTGNVSSIGKDVLKISYIDNIKGNKAPLNTIINIKKKFNYFGEEDIYYRLDFYLGNRLEKKGVCRQVNPNKIASFSFKLIKNRSNIVTGIYSDSSCKHVLSKYRTKMYYIGTDDSKIDINPDLPSVTLPKLKDVWYVGDSSAIFSVAVNPVLTNVNLESSDPSIMEIQGYGSNSYRLTAKKAGKVTITATSEDGIRVQNTYTVKEKNTIEMTKVSSTIKTGSYANITIKTSANDSIKNVESSNPSVIEVTKVSDNVYKLTAKNAGKVTITAISSSGAKVSHTYKVEEKAKISISKYESVLASGKTYGKYSLNVTPANSSVTLISSDPSVLQVMKYGENSWGLKAKKAGVVTVTAKSSNAKATYKYTVIEENEKNILMPKYPDVWKVGEQYGKFSVKVSPANSRVSLKSSDKSVIDIVNHGTNSFSLKALKPGTATIIATASNGLETNYTYTVKENPTISMKQFPYELLIGKTYGKFEIVTKPQANSVTLISSNPSVLQVMKYGENSWGLKAKKAGSVTITAKSSDGVQVSYTYVVKQETKITMPKYPDILEAGKTYGKFSVAVTPSNLSVTLSSSDKSVIDIVNHGTNSFSLKALKPGTATITAKSSDGALVSYAYTVKEKAKVSIPTFQSEWESGTESKVFSATVVPSSDKVNIKSSDSSIIEVIDNGNNKWKLKAKNAGTATITVSSSSGATQSYTYIVKQAPTINMQKFDDELMSGKTYGKFSLITNTTGDKVNLISSNESVISIINYGKNSWGLKAGKAGKAQITATSSSGAKLTYTYRVIENVLITNGSSLNKTWQYGDFEFLVVNKVSPSSSTIKVTSSNSNVISVETVKENVSWELNPVGVGTATITVSSSNGKSLSYTYTVVEPKNEKLISMPKYKDQINVGETYGPFSIDYSPSNASIKLESSDKSVIDIINHGKNSWSLKAKKIGTATITATSSIGAKVSYTYTVKEAPATISMTMFTENWVYGTGGNIDVSVTPANSTVKVTSSNPSVMRVKKISNTKWNLLTVGIGTSTITASASNGKSQSYTYTVSGKIYPTPQEMINNNYETRKSSGVTVYFEKSCSSSSKTNIIKFIDKLPNYAKKSAKFVYVMTKNTWLNKGHGSSVGLTWCTSNPYIALVCDGNFSDQSDNYALYHEYGHAVDAYYDSLTGDGYISKRSKYASLMNSAKNYSNCNTSKNKCSILRGYAYTNTGEFFAEAYMMYIRPQVGYNNNARGITSNWGPINTVKLPPYGTIQDEITKDINEAQKIIK